jgi:CheY-like chemotaxis protein
MTRRPVLIRTAADLSRVDNHVVRIAARVSCRGAQTVARLRPLNVRMPVMDGSQVQERLHGIGFTLPIIVMVGHADVQTAVSSFAITSHELEPSPKLRSRSRSCPEHVDHPQTFRGTIRLASRVRYLEDNVATQ